MKILHILSSTAYGGLELYTVQLIKEQIKLGWQVAVCVIEHSLTHKAFKEIQKSSENSNIDIYFLASSKKFNLRDIFFLKNLLTNAKVDLVHTHTGRDFAKIFLVSLLKKIRVVHSSYMGVAKKDGIIHKIMYQKIDAFITSSKQTNHFIRENYPIAPQKLHWIPYGRLIEQYQTNPETRKSIRDKGQISDNQLLVMSMSRIDPQKGIREFVESSHFLSSEEKQSVQFWVVGEPSILKTLPTGEKIFEPEGEKLNIWIDTYIAENDLKNVVKRFDFQKDFVQWLSASDVVVLPSYEEMYALTVIDAMLIHKPVIGTNSGGTTEQIENQKNGLLVEPKSAEAIAEAIKFYLANPSQRLKHGESAFEWAIKTHSMRESMQKLTKIYEDVIALN